MSVPAVLRHDQRLADMAGGDGVSESTVRRWRDELIGLLAAQAPRLDRALRRVAEQGREVVLIDGALICTLRRTGRAGRRSYAAGVPADQTGIGTGMYNTFKTLAGADVRGGVRGALESASAGGPDPRRQALQRARLRAGVGLLRQVALIGLLVSAPLPSAARRKQAEALDALVADPATA
ncbi:hypothetical protein [uncultured Streptomyces sp.]|uniref:hypothetical protein n=1 Tax=uncultured Streptomyces sp. TaxID=174707 RepID=UPI002615DB46|nr:hypothetical protein [uncultured Streptomyces sp.]